MNSDAGYFILGTVFGMIITTCAQIYLISANSGRHDKGSLK